MRYLLSVLFVLLPVLPVEAQINSTFEQIVISNVSIGLTPVTTTGMAGCTVIVETNAIRIRYDGGTPTATVGIPVPTGGTFILRNQNDLLKLRMIRQTVDATAWVSCWPSPGEAAPIGGGGGGTIGDTELPGPVVLADGTANPTVPGVSAFLMAYNGTTWDRVRTSTDPCSGSVKTPIVINIATATTTELTPTLAGVGNHYYVCSINLGPTAGAQNFALVDDDTDGCATPTSGLAGGLTAASGWNFAANGGLVLGNGQGTVARTGGTNRVICAVTSAAVQISGVMMVVAAP